MVNRFLTPSNSSSFFLFGARGVGKSTFLKTWFEGRAPLWFDLLDPDLEQRFSLDPKQFQQEIISAKQGGPGPPWVVVDEIQKCPKLLNLVHLLIEEQGVRFALTGSSARRLKQKGVNLLAGRAFVEHLFPLTSDELGDGFDLDHALQWGTLPRLLQLPDAKDKAQFLRSYCLTYLETEIKAEQWVRKLDPFRRFLQVAAQCNGKILNLSNIAKDVGADWTTVAGYFEILEDTLMGFLLEPYHPSVRKRQAKRPKFYFFDGGVRRALAMEQSVPLLPRTSAYGDAFESFLILEVHRRNMYLKRDFRLSYLRTKDDAEIDLILERPGTGPAIIEIKSKTVVDERDARTLNAFAQSMKGAEAFLLSQDPRPKQIGAVRALYWREGLQELGLSLGR